MSSSPALTAEAILTLLTEKKQSMAGAFGVREIGLFGSYADGQASPESDVDVLVDFESGRKSLFNFIRLKFELEELLGRKVDLVMKSALKPRLRERILSQVRHTEVLWGTVKTDLPVLRTQIERVYESEKGGTSP